MKNALGEPQNIVVLGGTSDIGVAIARRLMAPNTKRVTLACRRPDEAHLAVASLSRAGVVTEAVPFEATDVEAHATFVSELVQRTGDLDVVVLAFGQLGDQERLENDPHAAAHLIGVNFAAAASIALVVANQLRAQGHGRLVVLSSVAGERVRKANFVYGSSKAGLDGFAQGLADSLVGSGAGVLIVRPGFVHSAMTAGLDGFAQGLADSLVGSGAGVLIVRPGFVHSAMTAGLKPAPFATTPDAVADVVARGLVANRRIVWAPGILRVVFMILRHLPAPIWQRLPLG